MRRLFGVCARVGVFLALIVNATGANLPPPVNPMATKAPLAYSPDTGGFYLGLGTFLETASTKLTIGGTDISTFSNSGSLGGIAGYGRGNGTFWWAIEGGAYWTNLSNGCPISACLNSKFTGTALFELGVPQGILNALPNVGTIFPGLNTGEAAPNMYPYIGLGADFNDVSASLGQMNARDWQIPFKTRAGIKTKLKNGSVMDTWADVTFAGSGFAVGPSVTVNQGQTYKAGVTFAVGWGG